MHRTPSETPASLRTRTLKMAEKRSKGIPLRAFFCHFSGSRSPRCGGLMKCPMHHLSSHVATRKMVHRTPSETPASLRTRTLKMAKKRSKGIPLRAFFGHFSGSRSPRCGGLIKRAMHHLSSREAGRKMLHRTPSETPYTSRTRYPKMAVFDQIAFLTQPPI